MLRKTRVISASFVIIMTTLLFLDFTGVVHLYFGWLARMQLIPAILAVNTAAIAGLALATVVFGRIYCSVLCPLGIMQDIISGISARRRDKKNRFRHSKAKSWLRFSALALFIAGFVAGSGVIVSLLDPYAAYGRVASNIFAPVYRLGNNLAAWGAERADSYAFHSTEVWIKGWATFGVATISLIAIGVLAWRSGRIYCNTICPVGTVLGFISRFSIFRPAFDAEKCNGCGLCERRCKSSCINAKGMTIDQSRCVTCFNCVENCRSGAMKYALRWPKKKPREQSVEVVRASIAKNKPMHRRRFLSIAGLMAIAQTAKAQQLHVDGGLAAIQDKKIPSRKTPLVPPGAGSVHNIRRHCTACQLCVSSCPNNVLRPSTKLASFMQPEMHYDRGYCRPECVECSQVCPAGAINKMTSAEKSATSIGYAVWIKDNCVVNRDGVQCDACRQHCPTGAITHVTREPGYSDSLKIPVVDKELCIGCGACEYLCPARPFSAIYVEGNARHHKV